LASSNINSLLTPIGLTLLRLQRSIFREGAPPLRLELLALAPSRKDVTGLRVKNIGQFGLFTV